MYQNSVARMLTEQEVETIKSMRYLRKITDGAGLCLLVTPKGTQRWRFNYRFAGRYKSLSIGTYREITRERARHHHELVRQLLAHGIDPSALKRVVGKRVFAVTMREWVRLASDLRASSARTTLDRRSERSLSSRTAAFTQLAVRPQAVEAVALSSW
jgi:hypothetical protein